MEYLKKTGWTFVEILVFLATLFLTYFIIGSILSSISILNMGIESPEQTIEPYEGLIYDYIPLLIGSVAGILLVHQYIFRRSPAFSGFKRRYALSHWSYGFVIGFAMIGIPFCILWVFRLITIQEIQFDRYLFWGFLLFFIVQATVEELMLRSFLLPTLAKRFNVTAAVIISALAFTILHGANPNIGIVSILNIFLAGVMLGALFIKTEMIWAPASLHISWNFFQGSFFGFEVSGLDLYSWIRIDEMGNDLLTGGEFGLEGSILATAVLALVTFYIWRSSDHKFKIGYLSSPSLT